MQGEELFWCKGGGAGKGIGAVPLKRSTEKAPTLHQDVPGGTAVEFELLMWQMKTTRNDSFMS